MEKEEKIKIITLMKVYTKRKIIIKNNIMMMIIIN
jgi:hypothetical protein